MMTKAIIVTIMTMMTKESVTVGY